ncbi:hypothetical protein OOT33_13765 [Sphingobium sp. DEHP117]|uniref:hypothetical protein n=1 Tax=Sphingobium sp. DEHP117 TaxID=2993436 RepID=UPI0027D6FA47|nr:hypothetical protein [Sphingobium sp. DEHP117]MDQ4421490.1 hypothetical protein [Sphingobium sp. DEHP117]
MPQLPFVVVPTPLGTITTGNEISAKPAAHLNEFVDIGMTWKSNGNTNLWVRGNFGSAKPVDFVQMQAANAISATTIRIRLGDTQAEVDGTADYDSSAQPFISPSITSDDGLYHSHWSLPSVQTKQWWRIDIGSHTGDFEAANLILGQKVTPSRYYSAGFEMGVEDQGEIDFGRWGVADQTSGVILRTLKFDLEWLTEAEEMTMFAPLMKKLGTRNPALWCFDPESTVYRQAKTYFGVVRTNPFAVGGQSKPGTYSRSFSILSLI